MIHSCEHDAAIVVHEGIKCPVCEVIDSLRDNVEALELEMDHLQDDLDNQG